MGDTTTTPTQHKGSLPRRENGQRSDKLVATVGTLVVADTGSGGDGSHHGSKTDQTDQVGPAHDCHVEHLWGRRTGGQRGINTPPTQDTSKRQERPNLGQESPIHVHHPITYTPPVVVRSYGAS